jgi:hypothetical protein
MHRMKRLIWIGLAALMGAEAGCYGYYPVTEPVKADRRRVLVALNDSGTFLLAPKLGAFGSEVEGLLVDRPDSNYTLSVLMVRRYSGNEEDWKGERVVIPIRLTTSVTERHFSPGRTALFGGGLVALMTTLISAFKGGTSSQGSGTSGTVSGK